MATGTAGSAARDLNLQMVHYLRKSIAYTDNGSTVTVGTIPAGSLLIKSISGVSVNVAFDGNSSNVLDIGPSTDSGTNLWMTQGSLATIALVPLDEAVTMLVASDTIVQALVTSTASASAGTAEIIICYIPDNDG
jgi:hypothetical protein